MDGCDHVPIKTYLQNQAAGPLGQLAVVQQPWLQEFMSDGRHSNPTLSHKLLNTNKINSFTMKKINKKKKTWFNDDSLVLCMIIWSSNKGHQYLEIKLEELSRIWKSFGKGIPTQNEQGWK